jgi:hypothetical protein
MLVKHADEVEALVEALLQKHELSNAEVLQILGKNSIQIAVEQGLELESVLEQLGVNRSGLAYQRREVLAADPDGTKPKASVQPEDPDELERKRPKPSDT